MVWRRTHPLYISCVRVRDVVTVQVLRQGLVCHHSKEPQRLTRICSCQYELPNLYVLTCTMCSLNTNEQLCHHSKEAPRMCSPARVCSLTRMYSSARVCSPARVFSHQNVFSCQSVFSHQNVFSCQNVFSHQNAFSYQNMLSLWQVCDHSKVAPGLSRAPDDVGGIHTLLECVLLLECSLTSLTLEVYTRYQNVFPYQNVLLLKCAVALMLLAVYTLTHSRTHAYVCMCVCVCVWMCVYIYV